MGGKQAGLGPENQQGTSLGSNPLGAIGWSNGLKRAGMLRRRTDTKPS